MTFLNQLRDLAARARHSTEPGREVAELANLFADHVDELANLLAGHVEAQTAAFDAKIASLEKEIESLQVKLTEMSTAVQA